LEEFRKAKAASAIETAERFCGFLRAMKGKSYRSRVFERSRKRFPPAGEAPRRGLEPREGRKGPAVIADAVKSF